MKIVVGRGKSRKSVLLPSISAANNTQQLKIELEKGIDAVKSFLFRPALLMK